MEQYLYVLRWMRTVKLTGKPPPKKGKVKGKGKSSTENQPYSVFPLDPTVPTPHEFTAGTTDDRQRGLFGTQWGSPRARGPILKFAPKVVRSPKVAPKVIRPPKAKPISGPVQLFPRQLHMHTPASSLGKFAQWVRPMQEACPLYWHNMQMAWAIGRAGIPLSPEITPVSQAPQQVASGSGASGSGGTGGLHVPVIVAPPKTKAVTQQEPMSRRREEGLPTKRIRLKFSGFPNLIGKDHTSSEKGDKGDKSGKDDDKPEDKHDKDGDKRDDK